MKTSKNKKQNMSAVPLLGGISSITPDGIPYAVELSGTLTLLNEFPRATSYNSDQYAHFYEAVIDGSFSQGPHKSGTGALIAQPESNDFDQSILHKLKGKQTSVSAEIMAAVHALNVIPIGSSVKIYSDCERVHSAIKTCVRTNADDFINLNNKTRQRPERFALGELYSAIQRHREVVSSFAEPFDTRIQTALNKAHGNAKTAAIADQNEMPAFKSRQEEKHPRTGATDQNIHKHNRSFRREERGSRSQQIEAAINNSIDSEAPEFVAA